MTRAETASRRDVYDSAVTYDSSETHLVHGHDQAATKEETCQPTQPSLRPSAYQPLSIVIVVIWLALIVGELFVLERSVTVAHTAVSQPWYYSVEGLPNVLITLFAQGHGPITAMHFGRLAVSGLQYTQTAPKTWLELFWIADRKWAGPVGIVLGLWKIIKLRFCLRVSFTIILFSLISLITLVTPIILTRAYPVRTIDVQVSQSFKPNTLTPSHLGPIDGYNQVATGAGAWALNQTVFELFNTTTFVPPSSRRDTSAGSMFFAGDVMGMDTTLPGIRLDGGCHAVNDADDFSNYTTFAEFCARKLPHVSDMANIVLEPNGFALNLSYCGTSEWGGLTSPSNTSAFIWFENSNSTGMLVGDLTKGLVRCDSYLQFGTASLYGSDLTYGNFKSDAGLLTSTQGGEPLQDPLFLTLYYLGQGSKDSMEGQFVNLLSYTEEGSVFSPDDFRYRSPSLDGLADAMWRGTSLMALTIAILSRSADEIYPAILHVPVAGRVRVMPYFVGAISLLTVWLLGILGLTVAMWRPTAFGGSLDSYTAARLLADRVGLIDGEHDGGLEDNKRMVESFEPVAR